MTKQHRFMVMPVLVSGLALAMLFGAAEVDAGREHPVTVEDNRSDQTTGLTGACPYAGTQRVPAGHAEYYQQWLMRHVYGLHTRLRPAPNLTSHAQ